MDAGDRVGERKRSGVMRGTAWIVAFLVVLREMAVSQVPVIVVLSDIHVLLVDCDRALMRW